MTATTIYDAKTRLSWVTNYGKRLKLFVSECLELIAIGYNKYVVDLGTLAFFGYRLCNMQTIRLERTFGKKVQVTNICELFSLKIRRT